jgi:hypothetical protein
MSYLCELDLSGILFYFHASLRLVLIAPCVKAMKKRATGTLLFMAPAAGLEPATYWLTANRSTTELCRIT